MNITAIGLLGEWRAERFLKKKGMRLLCRRFKTPHGEIDLVLKDGETLVFAEVKYRPAGQMGQGASAVDMQKKKNLRYAARHYLSRHTHAFFRFDVVEITAAGIRHIPNAF